ncbi:hypothetical protein BKA67DRAFT_390470 [Truncatella angustata]|uniref:Uncharacterized protein n=1 Tax=Truncatella angustata TaxID=152316 RepID=A0A9P8RPW1_9PEZI|nr:uncharacterized protein BKA67DRAFT_390470 [Truncatella angustata]KAH6647537.1 hypothetical protein BKA67DRAFT_390470 [Truncatella angustata]
MNRTDLEAAVKNVLQDLPETAAPRSQWPTGDPRKQTAIETRCFEDGATIHFENLAPLQSWAPIVGMDMRKRTGFVVTNAVRLAVESNLKLTQAEIDAISESCAKNYNRGAWASPMATVLTAAAVYQGRDKFRFPFYTPTDSWFNSQSFPTKRWAFIKGPSATYAWHAFRFMAYYPLIKLATTLFYSSVIRMSLAADMFSDRRMARVNDAIMHKIAPNRPTRRTPQSQPGHQGSSGQPVEQSDAQRRDDSYRRVGLPPPLPEEVSRMARQGRVPEEQQDAQEPVSWGSSEQSQSVSQTDQSSPGRGGIFGRQTSPTSQTSSWGGAVSQDQPRQSEQSSSWGDSELFEDDASPVSAAARRAEEAAQSQAQSPSASRASAWDRVRQQAKSDAAPPAKGNRSSQDTTWGRLRQDSAPTDRDRDRTPPSESYSYNEADEAKDYARSQAQKEFDAMLEAERKGDPNSGNKWWK